MKIIETHTSEHDHVAVIRDGANTYVTIDRIARVGGVIVTTPERIERLDGLDCEVALRTARYLVGRAGGRILPTSRGFSVAAEGCDMPDLERMCQWHGFAVRVDRSGLSPVAHVDAATCPDDATPDERVALIRAESEQAGEEDGDDYDSYWRAYRQTEQWLRDYTIVALRLRAAAR